MYFYLLLCRHNVLPTQINSVCKSNKSIDRNNYQGTFLSICQSVCFYQVLAWVPLPVWVGATVALQQRITLCSQGHWVGFLVLVEGEVAWVLECWAHRPATWHPLNSSGSVSRRAYRRDADPEVRERYKIK